MARFRLKSGERSSAYWPGQWVSAAYAGRYPHKVERWPPEEPPEVPREWEVTAVKRTRRKRQPLTVDLTFRIIALPGTVPTKESVRKALWAWAVHGRYLTGYEVQGVNWRNIGRTRESEYEYDDPEHAREGVRPILRSLGMEKLRVAPVES